jgi:integrase
MRIYPRGKRGIMWVDVTVGGRRINRSSGTTSRAQAQEWAAKITHDTWRVRQLGQAPTVTWGYAVLHWLRTHASERRSIETMKDRIRFLTNHLEKTPLTKISADAIDKLLDDEKPQASLATRNRYVSEARKILLYAHRKGWLPIVPIFNHHSERQRSVRWITGNEAATLIKELPVHLGRMARFALATGLREANVRLLRWDQVDLDRRVAWIEGADMKAGKPLNVPLNADAIEVLRDCRGDHRCYVFVYAMPRPKGSEAPIVRRPVTQCSSLAWYKAVERAGLTPLRWHDLRHTWAS